MDDISKAISIDEIEAHHALWRSYLPLLSSGSLPQALLLLGPKHAHMRAFAYRWIASVFCKETELKPCGRCRSCEAIQKGMHPDLEVITKEDGATAIKIEQVRTLQETIYQTPSWQELRFVLLFPLDFLNLAASHALLKLLEEPPKHVMFILISEHYQVLPTLMSRCQRLFFHASESFRQLHENYLNIASHYPKTSLRYQLKDEQDKLGTTLACLLNNEIDVCQAAVKWKKIELDDFLWFFYLFTATCITKIKCGASQEVLYTNVIQHLCARFKEPMHLYAVLDKTTHMMATLKQNVTLNHDLVIETLFLSLIEAPYAYT